MSASVLVAKGDGLRSFSIDACLLQQRVVWMGEDFNNETSNSWNKQLRYLEGLEPGKPITVYLNSPGGSIVDGMAVYDTIQQITSPVHCVVTGMAASMGSVILSGCEKGQRCIMKHGEVLLHQPLGGARGPATDIQISAQRIIKMKETLLRLLAENCGQTYEKLREDCDRDYWLDAEEAVKYGICDRII